VKWWRRGCATGDPHACYLLGLAQLDGRGTGRDVEAGIAHLTGACEARSPAACRQLAGFYRAGTFIGPDEQAAAVAEQRACELGDGPSCVDIGLRARDDGRGELARTRLTEACERGDARGCALLGDLHAMGGGGVAVDNARAAEAYADACRGGLFEACGRAATVDGGAGIDQAELRVLYRVACDGGTVEACEYLAGMLLDGVGGPRDPQAAARLFDRACIDAHAPSCVHLAWMGRADGGHEPLQWLVRACDLDQGACVVLGEVHELGLVDGARLDAAAAAYQRGCAAESADACFRLGGLLARGAGAEQDDAAAARLYQVACEGGNAESCSMLARSYAEGVGVERSAAMSSHYRQQACALGETALCETTPAATGP